MFDAHRHQAFLQKLERGDLRQIEILDIDCNSTGWAPGASNGAYEKDGNSLVILKSWWSASDLKEFTSNTVARVMIHFNRKDTPGLPFSLVSSGVSDFGAICLPFKKFWVYVQTANAGHLYLAVLKGVNLYGTASANGYAYTQCTGGYEG